MNNQLEYPAIQENLIELPNWELTSDNISKTYILKDFKEAIKFINLVGDAAEEMDHHPDILLFGWNKVRITITTHSAKGLTQLDFDISTKIEKIFNNLNFEV